MKRPSRKAEISAELQKRLKLLYALDTAVWSSMGLQSAWQRLEQQKMRKQRQGGGSLRALPLKPPQGANRLHGGAGICQR